MQNGKCPVSIQCFPSHWWAQVLHSPIHKVTAGSSIIIDYHLSFYNINSNKLMSTCLISLATQNNLQQRSSSTTNISKTIDTEQKQKLTDKGVTALRTYKTFSFNFLLLPCLSPSSRGFGSNKLFTHSLMKFTHKKKQLGNWRKKSIFEEKQNY